MEYRLNRRTGDKLSVLGIGTSVLSEAPEAEAIKTLEKAYEYGINYFDLAAGGSAVFYAFGKAYEKLRKNLFYQIHFGADYSNGSYAWTTNLDTIKRSVDSQLKSLKTDYIDYAFIHCIDEKADFDRICSNRVYDYILELKKQGVAKHIGASSHTPATAELLLDTKVVDMLMFSINPAYDFEKGDDYGRGKVSERYALYRRCESEGVGISVMKPYCGGRLLSANTSPFQKALNQYQCIKYALDKPGVLTVLPGVANSQELEAAVGYFSAKDEQKDYSQIAQFNPSSVEGSCVYCNHCQPCPANIDIATVNKYYDLALSGDVLAKEHYKTLETNADNCINCGHCDSRCPFKVKQSLKMKRISEYFNN